MKINYKNTALGVIDYPDTYDFGLPPDMINNGRPLSTAESRQLGRDIIKGSRSLKELVGTNVQLVRNSFWHAFAKSRHKLKDIFTTIEIDEGGVLILEGNPFTHTYYYYVKTHVGAKDDEWDYSLLFMDFSKASINDEPHLDVYIDRSAERNETRSVIWKGNLDRGYDREHYVSMILSFLMFKKYCDIETKEISPKNRKIKIGNQKYLNETDKRISILDCTWFTNLVISGAFEVDGHLHWYWTGPGRSIKRLRWVPTYEKQGYARKAKALTYNPSNNELKAGSPTDRSGNSEFDAGRSQREGGVFVSTDQQQHQ